MADAGGAVGAEAVGAAVDAEPERSAEFAVFEFDADWHESFRGARAKQEALHRTPVSNKFRAVSMQGSLGLRRPAGDI